MKSTLLMTALILLPTLSLASSRTEASGSSCNEYQVPQSRLFVQYDGNGCVASIRKVSYCIAIQEIIETSAELCRQGQIHSFTLVTIPHAKCGTTLKEVSVCSQ